MTYFSISELSRSATAHRLGIDNTPSAAVKKNLEALVKYILDPPAQGVREAYHCDERVSLPTSEQTCWRFGDIATRVWPGG